MASDLLKVGLIGCGYWGKNYVRTINKIDNVKLSWIYSKTSKIPDNELPVEARFTNNYQVILDDHQTKAVIISTPPETHYQIARDSLEARKDVLVEKPMTTSSNEALELINIADEKGQIIMVGHIFLYNPAIVVLKKMMEDNEFGKLRYFYCRRTGNGPVRSDISVMWNLAPHDISIINYLSGQRPQTVCVNGACFLNDQIEDVVDLALEYEDNVRAFIHLSWLEPNKLRETTIVGDTKKAVFEDTSEDKITIYDSSGAIKSDLPKLKGGSPLENQCLHFVECVLTRKQPFTDGYAGYENVRILEFAQKSLENRKIVTISM